MIYLDYNATSPVLPQVKQAYLEGLDIIGNPSSIHTMGRKARKITEESREKIANFMGVAARNIIFCSCGTEANNMAIRGHKLNRNIVSSIEHDSILKSVEKSQKPFQLIECQKNGIINLEHLRNLLIENNTPAFVSVMLANNETGVVQPIVEIADIVHEFSGLLHVDAVQGLGKMPFGYWTYAADLITISPHKAGGAKGVAALIIKDNIVVEPLLSGGGQERSLRAGTENVAAIHAFGAFIDYCRNNDDEIERQKKLLDYLKQNLKTFNVHIIAENSPSLPNTISIANKKTASEKQIIILDLNNICVSSGSACSSGKVKKSHVLTAMGLDNDIIQTAIRISIGWQTTQDDIDIFLKVYAAI